MFDRMPGRQRCRQSISGQWPALIRQGRPIERPVLLDHYKVLPRFFWQIQGCEVVELGSLILALCGKAEPQFMITIADLKLSSQLIEDLAWPFDFDLTRADDDASWIKLDPETPFDVIAGEGTGGIFLTYGIGDKETLPILHATSEGQSGRVAENLTEFLGVLMAVPYWRDLLKFSGNGSLAEMRKTAEFMECEYAHDYPNLSEAQNRIMGVLPIPEIKDPVKVLHDSIHATDCVLVADDGWRYESLFNSFVASDNRNWQ